MTGKKKEQLKNNHMELLNPKEFGEILKIDRNKAEKFVLSARKQNPTMNVGFYKEGKLANKDKNKDTIFPLNSENINEILEGGFHLGKLYLLFGEFATGKSQICHNLCVQVYGGLKEGKIQCNIIFIDTENTFRPKRIVEISENEGRDYKEVLNSIKVLNAPNTESIFLILNKLEKESYMNSVKMIVIDSLTNHIRVDLGNDNISNIKVRETLIKILQKIRELKNKFNLLVVITSQVKGLPSNISGFTIKPILEYIINEYVEESILLSRSDDGIRYAFLMNSCSLPENNVEFRIAKEGIIDN
jgi:DNA repair protein RadA